MGTVILIVFGALAVLGGLAGLAYRIWSSRYIPWKPLIGVIGVEWAGMTPVEVLSLRAALEAAEKSLAKHTKWGLVGVQRARNKGLRIYVTDSESWLDLWGRKVAGVQLGQTLVVGPSYAALCHELAHRLEDIDGEPYNHTHFGWDYLGIQTAISEYIAWLAQEKR